MSEYGLNDVQKVIASGAPATRIEESSRDRIVRNIELILASIALVLTAFASWVQVRLPGVSRRRLSLIDLDGGRLLLSTTTILLVLGLVIAVKFDRLGKTLQGFGVAVFGWLAGFLVISISVVRGLIPNVSLAGIDLSDGLVGQGTGAVLAIVTAIFLGLRITATPQAGGQAGREVTSPLNAALLAFTITIAISNHMPWMIAESDRFTGRLEISGDALFGNFVVGILTWLTVAMCAASMASASSTTARIGAGFLVALSIAKVLQVVVLWAGKGLVFWMTPDVVEGAASVGFRPALFTTLIVSVLAIPLSILQLVKGVEGSMGRVKVPNLPIAMALFVAALGLAIFDDRSTSSVDAVSETSTTTTSQASNSTLVASTVAASTGDPIYSVVFVQMTDGYDVCWIGSGVIVGDGTRVLTNAHVALTSSADPPECTVLEIGLTASASDEPSEFYEAIVIDADEANDLALLEIVGVQSGQLEPLRPEFSELQLGAEVSVLGYPAVGGSTITLTKGTLAGVVTYEGETFYKVEVTINRGNSGGPMIDAAGNLVGIATAVTGNDVDCSGSDCRSYGSNLGLVRPIRFARPLLDLP